MEAEVEDVCDDPHRRYRPLILLGQFIFSHLLFLSVCCVSLRETLRSPSVYTTRADGRG